MKRSYLISGISCGILVLLLACDGKSIAASQDPSGTSPKNQPEPSKPQSSNKQEAVLGSRITIEVTGGEKDVPVENASIYVKYVEEHAIKKNKKFEMNVKTNQDGTAHMPDVPLGRVLIQVVADGWKTYGRWFDITDPKQVFKIHLERPPKWY